MTAPYSIMDHDNRCVRQFKDSNNQKMMIYDSKLSFENTTSFCKLKSAILYSFAIQEPRSILLNEETISTYFQTCQGNVTKHERYESLYRVGLELYFGLGWFSSGHVFTEDNYMKYFIPGFQPNQYLPCQDVLLRPKSWKENLGQKHFLVAEPCGSKRPFICVVHPAAGIKRIEIKANSTLIQELEPPSQKALVTAIAVAFSILLFMFYLIYYQRQLDKRLKAMEESEESDLEYEYDMEEERLKEKRDLENFVSALDMEMSPRVKRTLMLSKRHLDEIKMLESEQRDVVVHLKDQIVEI